MVHCQLECGGRGASGVFGPPSLTRYLLGEFRSLLPQRMVVDGGRFRDGVLVTESWGRFDYPQPLRAELLLHAVVPVLAFPLLVCSYFCPALLVSSRLNKVHPVRGKLLACLSR